MKTRHHRQLSVAEERMKWHSSTWHVPDSEERQKVWTEYRRLISSFPEELNRPDRALDPLGQIGSKVRKRRNNDRTRQRIGGRLRHSTEEQINNARPNPPPGMTQRMNKYVLIENRDYINEWV